MAGLDLDIGGALTVARELGATGWASAELLLALRQGIPEGRAETATPTGEGA